MQPQNLSDSDFVDNLSPSRDEELNDFVKDDDNLHVDYNDYVDETPEKHRITRDYLTVLNGGDSNNNIIVDSEQRESDENCCIEKGDTPTIPIISYTNFVDEEIATSISNSFDKNHDRSKYPTDLESAAIMDEYRSCDENNNNIEKSTVSILLNASVMPTISNNSKNEDGCTTDNNSSDCSSVDIPVLEDAFDDTDTCIKLPLAGTKYYERVPQQSETTGKESRSINNDTNDNIHDQEIQNDDIPNCVDLEKGVVIRLDGQQVQDSNDDGTAENHQHLEENDDIVYRHVPGGCVICLCPYEVGERVTWSSNTECKHSFHNECILDWLKTSGKRSLKRLRRNRDRSQQNPYDVDIVVEITSGPWACPVCRQDFIVMDPKYSPVVKVLLSDSESQGSGNNDTSGPMQTDDDVVDTAPTIDVSVSGDTINATEPDVNSSTVTPVSAAVNSF
jgi:Ring finger domain